MCVGNVCLRVGEELRLKLRDEEGGVESVWWVGFLKFEELV